MKQNKNGVSGLFVMVYWLITEKVLQKNLFFTFLKKQNSYEYFRSKEKQVKD